MNRQLRQRIQIAAIRRKADELRLANLIFIACIETRLLPSIGSPCHAKLKEIAR